MIYDLWYDDALLRLYEMHIYHVSQKDALRCHNNKTLNVTVHTTRSKINGCTVDNEVDTRNHTDLCTTKRFKANCDDKSAI